MQAVRSLVCLLLAPVVAGLAGCADQESLNAPERSSLSAGSLHAVLGPSQLAASDGSRSGQFRRIWPHEDGRGWTYRLTSRTWDEPEQILYPSPDQAPVLTLDEAMHLLGSQPIGEHPETNTGTYRLQFNGSITTESGVTRQYLQETLEPEGSAVRLSSVARRGSGFVQLLRRARPDVAKKLDLERPAIEVQRTGSLPRPTLLHGYAWEQTNEWIGTYGDLNRQIAWIFLTSDLRAGSEFSLQLVPDLADDVFLHARILGWKDIDTEAGTFHHALEVLYLVDFGVGQATDNEGNPLGYFRSFMYGTIAYAVGAGPVHSYERLLLFFDPLGRGNSDITASLTATTKAGGAFAAR